MSVSLSISVRGDMIVEGAGFGVRVSLAIPTGWSVRVDQRAELGHLAEAVLVDGRTS
jgi:hypothetical protein